MSEPVRVVTVFQPWASLIMVGAKPYEFRSKRPPRTIVGQRVVIHAAARKIVVREVTDIITRLRQGGDALAETCLIPDLAWPILRRAVGLAEPALPLGCGLGTAICGEGRNGVEIAESDFGLSVEAQPPAPIDFNPNSGAENPFDDEEDAPLSGRDSDRGEHANYGWPMTDIEVWPEPVPARGSQGIWFWPTPAAVGL